MCDFIIIIKNHLMSALLCVLFSLMFHFQGMSLQKRGSFMNKATKYIDSTFQPTHKSVGII